MHEPDAKADALLKVSGLQGWYGESHVLHGVDFSVGKGELVTLVGRNGAGKTTILRSIIGLLERREGSIVMNGCELIGLPPEQIAREGIGYCPEERGIFSALSVEENLVLPPALKDGGMSIDEIYGLFPNLRERRRNSGAKLSGGEQQMLAIARIMRTGCELLLLDEPTEGLAPVIVQQIERVVRDLKRRGFTIVLVEQNFHFATSVADHLLVIEHGQVIESISRAQMAEPSVLARLQAYVGV